MKLILIIKQLNKKITQSYHFTIINLLHRNYQYNKEKSILNDLIKIKN